MDEALRRAYLAAMEIPVWIPRGERDVLAGEGVTPAPPDRQSPAVVAEAPRSPGPVMRPRAPAPSSSAPRVRTPDAAAPVASAPRSAGASALVFGFVRCGATLLVDASGLSPRSIDLARAVCFAVQRQKLPFETQDFVWPPRGAPMVAAEARDALLARIDKFGGEGLQRLLLLGEAPASLLLGWDPGQWSGRPLAAQRVEGLGSEVLLLPSLEEMLGSVDAKRLGWAHLRNLGVFGA